MKPRTLIPGIGLLVLLLLGITRTSGAVDSPGADRGEAMAGELLVGVRPESDDRCSIVGVVLVVEPHPISRADSTTSPYRTRGCSTEAT